MSKITEKQIELVEYFETEDFKNQFKKIWDELFPHNYYYEDNHVRNLKQYFESINRTTSRSQENLKVVFEEAKRMLITLFYLVDTINDGGTHREKQQYTNTALQVLRKQIIMFDDMSEKDNIRSYFEGQGWRSDSIILSHEYQAENKELKNERKGLHQEIKYLKDLVNGKEA